jgi:hypothetical protein
MITIVYYLNLIVIFHFVKFLIIYFSAGRVTSMYMILKPDNGHSLQKIQQQWGALSWYLITKCAWIMNIAPSMYLVVESSLLHQGKQNSLPLSCDIWPCHTELVLGASMMQDRMITSSLMGYLSWWKLICYCKILKVAITTWRKCSVLRCFKNFMIIKNFLKKKIVCHYVYILIAKSQSRWLQTLKHSHWYCSWPNALFCESSLNSTTN